MQSRSLRAEAMETLFCDLQDLTILVGIGLNSLFSWWWADPVSALLLVYFFVKEGRENFFGHGDEHEEDEPRVCFCGGCLLRPAGMQCRALPVLTGERVVGLAAGGTACALAANPNR